MEFVCWRRIIPSFIASILAVCPPALLYAHAADEDPALASVPGLGRTVAIEQFLMNMNPVLGDLEQSALNLTLPDHKSRALFAGHLEVTDLTAAPPASSTTEPAATPLRQIDWKAADAGTTVALGELRLWRPFFDQVSAIARVRISAVDGRYIDDVGSVFRSVIRFEARAFARDGAVSSANALVTADWRVVPGVGMAADEKTSDSWRIVRWKTENFTTSDAGGQLFFEDVTESGLPSKETLQKARDSIQEQLTADYISSRGQKKPHPFFQPHAWGRRSGVSVVDINRDGFDDIYSTDQWGPNLLLRNRGNGTFDNVGQESGLDIIGNSSAALFADFDNDGDTDLFLAKTYARSAYLVNENGKFIDRSADLVSGPLPFLASSVSAADYDSDGLLDLYVSTYAGHLISRESLEGIKQFLSEEEHKRLKAEVDNRVADDSYNLYLNLPGPPNVLLHNVGGGRFEIQADSPLALWRNTNQSSWCDYDNDGDPDVYCANDFGPDTLFRNDGNGVFVDVTEPMRLSSAGYAMGVSWGDYDNDGKFDLYKSSVHSEEGRRIAAGVPGLDPRVGAAARGNALFRNLADRFQRVSGDAKADLHVQDAGWSWGGQFVDVDNDARADIYALSGFYTAPKSVAFAGDGSASFWLSFAHSDKLIGSKVRLESLVGGGIPYALSVGGRQRDRLFISSASDGSFVDASGVSGLDDEAAGRSFAIGDFNRDGWPDIALMNANSPRLRIYENQISRLQGEPGVRAGVIAVRLFGSNTASTPDKTKSNRDGIGARIKADLGDTAVHRELRAGEGFGAQNSRTMLIGLGGRTAARSIEVRWPSGAVQSVNDVKSGVLLGVYEDPKQSPSGQAFMFDPYRVSFAPPQPPAKKPLPRLKLSASSSSDSRKSEYRLYLLLSPRCAGCRQEMTQVETIRKAFPPEKLEITVVEVREAGDERIAGNDHFPIRNDVYRVIPGEPAADVAELTRITTEALGGPMVPACVIADGEDQLLQILPEVPSISALGRVLSAQPGN